MTRSNAGATQSPSYERPLYLSFPSAEQITAAFRDALPFTQLFVVCRPDRLTTTLRHLEDVGFTGMTGVIEDPQAKPVFVTAAKGTEVTDAETTHRARYTGAAAAVLDDNRHLMIGSVRIPEKTAALYRMPMYVNVVEVAAADQALGDGFGTDAVPGAPETYRETSVRLRDLLEDEPRPDEPRVTAIYPGPFRLLILHDGSMVRRGQPTRLRLADAQRLESADGCVRLPDVLAPDAPAPDNVRDYCIDGDIASVLSGLPMSCGIARSETLPLQALNEIPDDFRQTLQAVIEREEPYLLLTGSDPADTAGCCPNTMVAWANALVAAGILESWSPPQTPGTCPTGIYAFQDEIDMKAGAPQFHLERRTRAQILRQLLVGPTG